MKPFLQSAKICVGGLLINNRQAEGFGHGTLCLCTTTLLPAVEHVDAVAAHEVPQVVKQRQPVAQQTVEPRPAAGGQLCGAHHLIAASLQHHLCRREVQHVVFAWQARHGAADVDASFLHIFNFLRMIHPAARRARV